MNEETRTALDAMLEDDSVRLWMRLRKTSEEVLFGDDNTHLAGKKLVQALEELESMITIPVGDWVGRCKAYDQLRQHVDEGLKILNLPDDFVFEENTLFLPTIVKHLRYFASFIEQMVDGDQGFNALELLITGETLGLTRRLLNEYRRLLFLPLK